MTVHRLGKVILSQLLCIGAVFSACTDDEVFNQTTKALQVSVSTETPAESRAIIDGGYLPDGASIGVTLIAEDGSAYDGQAFTNLQYTAAGEGSSQTWSSATPASLSITAGKVIAYYPYYDSDDFDLKAVPVETTSQTDYMYAKPVTGINMVSPAANLTMQHAMTDIRINVKKGTYTGTGEVTKITAKAPAFATSATMDVETGVFANVSGSGAQFVQELTGTAISSGNVVHDFLIVPDVKSTSGEVSIFVIIDGKKFAVTVPYTECFQQGFAYTYNLTLDNAALTLDGVNVAKWGVKAEVDESLQFYDDQYIVEIQVPSDNYTYGHNIDGFIGTIDWGDGTTTEYTTEKVMPVHTYATAGDYVVVAEGKIKALDSYRIYDNGMYRTPTPKIKKIINIGKDMGVKFMGEAFYGQTLLSEIVPGALDGCTEVTSFYQTFRGCTNLASIPIGLFNKCTKVTNFSYTFEDCSSLTSIPEALFDKCTEVNDFSCTFCNCYKLQTIPVGLFDKCTKVTSFAWTFGDNEFNSKKMEIVSIPRGLFDKCTEVTTFKGAFKGCTKISEIPSGLFDKNTKVTNFDFTFGYCSGLQAIPEGLFDKCTEVTNFGGTFHACISIQAIPEGLFDYNTKVTSFMGYSSHYYGCFSSCVSLQSIPEGLFDNCTEVTDFGKIGDNNNNGIFALTNISAIPEGLFDKNTKVTSFDGAFSKCNNLLAIPTGLFDNCPEVTDFNGTFQGCASLQTIPEGLFKYNTKVTDFGYTFDECASLQTIPQGLFDNNTEVTNFLHIFDKCTALQTIPMGLFDYNTEVTSFSYAFYQCRNLKSIPVGLFDYNTKVTNFDGTFYYCDDLTEIPAGLFDNNTKVTSFHSTFSVPVFLIH